MERCLMTIVMLQVAQPTLSQWRELPILIDVEVTAGLGVYL